MIDQEGRAVRRYQNVKTQHIDKKRESVFLLSFFVHVNDLTFARRQIVGACPTKDLRFSNHSLGMPSGERKKCSVINRWCIITGNRTQLQTNCPAQTPGKSIAVTPKPS